MSSKNSTHEKKKRSTQNAGAIRLMPCNGHSYGHNEWIGKLCFNAFGKLYSYNAMRRQNAQFYLSAARNI